jgi:hypothetical protein
MQEYYEIKAQIMQKLKNEDETFNSMLKLEEIILENYSEKS